MIKFREPVTVENVIEFMKSCKDNDFEEAFCVYGKGFSSLDLVGLDTVCYLDEYESYDEETDVEIPTKFVKENGLEFWFTDELLQLAVSNAIFQDSNVSNKLILQGIYYYEENDTFMDLKS